MFASSVASRFFYERRNTNAPPKGDDKMKNLMKTATLSCVLGWR
jgi:hypothetical protein